MNEYRSYKVVRKLEQSDFSPKGWTKILRYMNIPNYPKSILIEYTCVNCEDIQTVKYIQPSESMAVICSNCKAKGAIFPLCSVYSKYV